MCTTCCYGMGSKFHLVSDFMEFHALTLATHSYALLVSAITGTMTLQCHHKEKSVVKVLPTGYKDSLQNY